MTLQEFLETKLGKMASQDPNFRERYNDKQKSITDCIRYITQQARKQAVNNCAAISDEDILQMAVHYYQEADVNPTDDTPKAKIVAIPKTDEAPNEDKPQPVLIPKPQPKKTKKAKKVDNSLQLDLFGEF